MAKGTIKWFNAGIGMGLIMPDGENERDIQVRSLNIETPEQQLHEGQRVEYEVVHGRRGPEAVRVRSIS